MRREQYPQMINLIGLLCVTLLSWNNANATIAPNVLNDLYYSNKTQYNYAVSADNFYATRSNQNTSLGYKSISDSSNTLNDIDITPIGAVILQISAYTSGGSDILWGIDLFSALYCGTINGLSTYTSSMSFSKVSIITVGPTGVWAADILGNLYNNASLQCNDVSPWVFAGVGQVDYASAGLTGLYYHNSNGIFQITSPTATPVAVPNGGPSSSQHQLVMTRWLFLMLTIAFGL